MSKAPMKIWSTLKQCKIATTQTVLTMILGPIISALLLDNSGHNQTLFKNVLPLLWHQVFGLENLIIFWIHPLDHNFIFQNKTSKSQNSILGKLCSTISLLEVSIYHLSWSQSTQIRYKVFSWTFYKVSILVLFHFMVKVGYCDHWFGMTYLMPHFTVVFLFYR